MSQPRNARPQVGGGRKYVWKGPDGETESFDSVTTILNRVLAKPALTAWAARSCGEYVRDKMNFLYGAWKDDRENVVTLIKEVPWKLRDTAADIGSLVHDIAERTTLGQQPGIPVEAEGFIAAWSNWMRDFNVSPILSEATVYNREHGYAGTLDTIVTIPVLGTVLVDLKTGKDVYPEAGLQMTAYRDAEFIGMPDGTEAALPAFDGQFVLHLQADGHYNFVPVYYAPDAWDCVLELFAWSHRSDLIGPVEVPGRML